MSQEILIENGAPICESLDYKTLQERYNACEWRQKKVRKGKNVYTQFKLAHNGLWVQIARHRDYQDTLLLRTVGKFEDSAVKTGYFC